MTPGQPVPCYRTPGLCTYLSQQDGIATVTQDRRTWEVPLVHVKEPLAPKEWRAGERERIGRAYPYVRNRKGRNNPALGGVT